MGGTRALIHIILGIFVVGSLIYALDELARNLERLNRNVRRYIDLYRKDPR